jgi:LysM repeat protein
MSLGGYGALDFAAAYPKETAAAMAFCGGSTRKPADLARLNEVPLWIMHGTADNLVPVSESRRVQKAMKEANSDTPRLRYDEFVGAGHSLYARTFYTGEAYEWLFKHSTNDPMRPVDRTVQIPHSRLSNQPYRGLKFRSVPLNVVQKSVAVPETSKLKHTRSVPQKKAEMAAGNYHTIAAGDTLTKLAKMYNTTIKQLCEWNNITETSILKVGQKIVVKGANSKHKYHTIVAGDTLSGLAVKYNTTVKQICQWNNITENTILQLNKKLRVK